jgi:hypothetical protein
MDTESRSVGAVTAASIVRHFVIANYVERMMKTEDPTLVYFSTTAGHFSEDPEILQCRVVHARLSSLTIAV